MISNQENHFENERGKFEHLRIRDTTPIQPPLPTIKIGGETITTKGNLTTISGDSKSGKSAFTSILISAASSENGIVEGMEELFVQPNTEGGLILQIDTEHSPQTHKKNLVVTLNRIGLENCPEWLVSYNLRYLEPEEILKITNEICEFAYEKIKNIHMIVIDGGADYLSDVNDPVESNAVIKNFEKLAIKFNTSIIITVHTNPGKTQKEMGYFGSHLQRRSESVLTIKKENDFSYVIPKYLRMAGESDILPIAFKYDKERGFHTGCKINNINQIGVEEDRVTEISKICSEVFSNGITLLKEEAIDAIVKIAHITPATAKVKFKEMLIHEMIMQCEDKKRWQSNPQVENK